MSVWCKKPFLLYYYNGLVCEYQKNFGNQGCTNILSQTTESKLDILKILCYILMESKLSICLILLIRQEKGVGRLKNRLEELRRQHGITQEELALILEVSRQTIGSLECGRYNPSILLAFKIAKYFHTTVEEIFIYEEDQES